MAFSHFCLRVLFYEFFYFLVQYFWSKIFYMSFFSLILFVLKLLRIFFRLRCRFCKTNNFLRCQKFSEQSEKAAFVLVYPFFFYFNDFFFSRAFIFEGKFRIFCTSHHFFYSFI